MSPRLKAGLLDGLVAVLLAVVSIAIALHFLRAEARRSYFFDWELVPATTMACGRGFTQPPIPIAALTEFVARRAPAFDCAQIAAGPPLIGAGALANANRYGLYGPALAMRLAGVSWDTLDRYVAALFGLAMVLTYALLRQVSLPVFAALGTLILACSSKLQEVVSHRDYIKEPPFLALLVVMAWLVTRQRTRREIWGGAVAGGLLLGIGIGYRADLMIFGPFFAAALLVFANWSPGVGGIRNRIAALALFVVGFAVTGMPILRTISGGSNLSHTVLMGFMTPFTRHLGLEVPAYDVGSIYADGYTYTLIAAQARIREKDLGPVPFGEAPYDRAGARLWTDIARRFPADLLARGYGAVIEALQYPLSHDALYVSRAMPGFSTSPVLSIVANARFRVLVWFEDHGAWIAIAALIVVAAVNLRLAIFATLLVLYFCAYSMLQFSRRHTFQLDVFTIAAAMFLLHALITAVRHARGQVPVTWTSRSAAIGAAQFVALAAVVLVLPLATLRGYQQGQVETMIDATLAASREPVTMVTAADGADHVLMSSPVLGERHVPGPVDDVRDVRMEYLVATFEGTACGTEPFEVELTYTGVVKTFDKEFNRRHVVTPSAGAAWRLMSPVFYEYGPYWLRFDGFKVPAAKAACLTLLTRADRPGDLPMPFLYATLAPDWRNTPLYQRFTWE